MRISRREFVGRGVAVGAVAAMGLRGVAEGGAPVSIRAAGAGRGILAGCAVNGHALRSDAAYKKLLVGTGGDCGGGERVQVWAAAAYADYVLF